MDAAWYNHNPVDGNMGMETLTKLDRTVEATRVAVAHVLQISGDAVEIEREADLSALVTTHDEDSQASCMMGVAEIANGTMEAAALAKMTADGVGRQATSDNMPGESHEAEHTIGATAPTLAVAARGS
jgi:hypothetical protein